MDQSDQRIQFGQFGFAIFLELACKELVMFVRPPKWRHACTEWPHKSHPVSKGIHAMDVVVSQPSCLTADGSSGDCKYSVAFLHSCGCMCSCLHRLEFVLPGIQNYPDLAISLVIQGQEVEPSDDI